MTQLQFTTQLFTILNDLLEAGITSCNVHQARLEFDYLVDQFEEMDGLEIDEPITLNNFFPDLQDGLNSLTIFPESKDVTHGAI